MNNKTFLLLIVSFGILASFRLSFAEEKMTLEQAKSEIVRLEEENQGLRDRLEAIKQEIADYKEKIENHEVDQLTSEQ